MSKQTLSVTRLNNFTACQRKHYYAHELGLRRIQQDFALRFGGAWHACLEARWIGATYDAALAAGFPADAQWDEFTLATGAAMLAGYYRRWENEIVASIRPEVEFTHPIAGSRSFESHGFIDGLGVLVDGRQAVVESKTTSEELGDDSGFWERTKNNQQIMQYVLAARALGCDIRVVIYDVTRKPALKQSQIPLLDDAGLKIVRNEIGVRVLLANGKPRQSADKDAGQVLQTRLETPDEYFTRLSEDIADAPEKYFQRREVEVLDDDLAEYEAQRLTIANQIQTIRRTEKRCAKRHQAWPRNISTTGCKFCEFSSFCLQNLEVDPASPPAGFEIKSEPVAAQPELLPEWTAGLPKKVATIITAAGINSKEELQAALTSGTVKPKFQPKYTNNMNIKLMEWVYINKPKTEGSFL